MKSKNKTLEVNEYKIKFIYDNPKNIHTRYFQSISLEQVQNNLNKIIGDNDYQLVSIERYNRWTDKWEQEQDEIAR